MTEPPSALAGVLSLDRTVHEPIRLCVLAILYSVTSADFVYLQRTLGLTGGNLSAHVSKLTDAGLVEAEKSFVDNRPRTTLSLTARGRTVMADYLASMGAFVAHLSTGPGEP